MAISIKAIWIVAVGWTMTSALAVALFDFPAEAEFRLAWNILCFVLVLTGVAWMKNRCQGARA